jgi:hypothetical protein
MTQPKIDWESLGKAAGAREKNTRPGIRITRPIDWTPKATTAQTQRSHQATKRSRNELELQRKLDAVLGPVEEDE